MVAARRPCGQIGQTAARECLRTCPLLNGLGLNGRSIPFGMGTASGSFEPLAIFPTGDYGHDLAG